MKRPSMKTIILLGVLLLGLGGGGLAWRALHRKPRPPPRGLPGAALVVEADGTLRFGGCPDGLVACIERAHLQAIRPNGNLDCAILADPAAPLAALLEADAVCAAGGFLPVRARLIGE
ncbi:MAG: hypothetical protein HY904_10275 [Deltaproteobacteria bacterium]|nr:hypothetical protein [Deltaproteobacteria bacterium]